MSQEKITTEAQILENYNPLFTELQNNPKISQLIRNCAYDDIKISQGEALLDEAVRKYKTARHRFEEKVKAYQEFNILTSRLSETYFNHRIKARTIWKDDNQILESLGITESLPQHYSGWFDTIRTFYIKLAEDSKLFDELNVLDFTDEQLYDALDLMEELKKSRKRFLKTTENFIWACREKEASLNSIDKWMKKLYEALKASRGVK